MIFSFVGMSGTGKSFWSKRLAAEEGFLRICLDDLIEERLGKLLAERGITAVASWMGLPYEERYAENEALYLELEREVTRETLDRLSNKPEQKLIIDTTGSVIYTGEEICAGLRSVSYVVHLRVPPGMEQRFLDKYLTKPKPVIWNNHFRPMPGETNEEALRRCYPLLLRSRLESYDRLADTTIGPEVFLDREQTAANFLKSFYRDEIFEHKSP